MSANLSNVQSIDYSKTVKYLSQQFSEYKNVFMKQITVNIPRLHNYIATGNFQNEVYKDLQTSNVFTIIPLLGSLPIIHRNHVLQSYRVSLLKKAADSGNDNMQKLTTEMKRIDELKANSNDNTAVLARACFVLFLTVFTSMSFTSAFIITAIDVYVYAKNQYKIKQVQAQFIQSISSDDQ